MRSFLITALLAVVGIASPLAGQQQSQAGPAILSGGAVYGVEETWTTPTDVDYEVAFEAAVQRPGELNVVFNSLARFINMHAQAGVPRERIRTAVVVHGTVGWDLLDDEAYAEKFGTANPNSELLFELMEYGAEVILCGQTAAGRGIPTDRLVEGTDIALSAMTAFVLLQDRGYKVNPW